MSVIYPRSRGWGKGKNFRSRGKGCLTWSRKSLEPSSQSAILKITQKAQFVLDLFAVFQKDRKCHSTKPGYVKRETRKAVVAGSFEEFAKAGELFCCSISEIQSDMYSECLQRGYGTIIFSLTDPFKVYNTCYSDLCFILRVKSLTFCYKNTKHEVSLY